MWVNKLSGERPALIMVCPSSRTGAWMGQKAERGSLHTRQTQSFSTRVLGLLPTTHGPKLTPATLQGLGLHHWVTLILTFLVSWTQLLPALQHAGGCRGTSHLSSHNISPYVHSIVFLLYKSSIIYQGSLSRRIDLHDLHLNIYNGMMLKQLC